MSTVLDPESIDLMPEAEITNAELYRLYTAMRHDNQASFKALDDRLSTSVVLRDVYEAQTAALRDRVTVLEAAEKTRENRRFALIAAIAGGFAGDLVAILVAVFHK